MSARKRTVNRIGLDLIDRHQPSATMLLTVMATDAGPVMAGIETIYPDISDGEQVTGLQALREHIITATADVVKQIDKTIAEMKEQGA